MNRKNLKKRDGPPFKDDERADTISNSLREGFRIDTFYFSVVDAPKPHIVHTVDLSSLKR